MRRLITSALAVTALVAVPTVSQAANSTRIGTGSKTCTLKPGADCSGVTHRWTVEHHGNLRRINLRQADLRGADFRGVDLRNADLRGSILRHVNFRDAKLRGARFGPAPVGGKVSNQTSPYQTPSCAPNCAGADLRYGVFGRADLRNADLRYANLSGSYFTGADFSDADMTGAALETTTATLATFIGTNLTNAYLAYANLTGSYFGKANLTGANLTAATLAQVTWNKTTCPDGTVQAGIEPCAT